MKYNLKKSNKDAIPGMLSHWVENIASLTLSHARTQPHTRTHPHTHIHINTYTPSRIYTFSLSHTNTFFASMKPGTWGKSFEQKNEIENEEESTEKKTKKKDGGFSCSLQRPVLHVVRAEKNGKIPASTRTHTNTQTRTHTCTHTHSTARTLHLKKQRGHATLFVVDLIRFS